MSVVITFVLPFVLLTVRTSGWAYVVFSQPQAAPRKPGFLERSSSIVTKVYFYWAGWCPVGILLLDANCNPMLWPSKLSLDLVKSPPRANLPHF